MYALKDVTWSWLFYVGALLILTMLLYLPYPSPRIKGTMAAIVILAGFTGIALLWSTNLGQNIPLMNLFAQANVVESRAKEGLEVYFKYGCPNCHLLNGWGPPKSIGPDLAVAISDRGSDWVIRYLRDPGFRSTTSNSVMPHYTYIKQAELDKLIIFLDSAGQFANYHQ